MCDIRVMTTCKSHSSVSGKSHESYVWHTTHSNIHMTHMLGSPLTHITHMYGIPLTQINVVMAHSEVTHMCDT